MKPDSAISGVLNKMPPVYSFSVNEDCGFFPETPGDLNGPGKLVRGPQPISGGPDVHAATSQHDWNITDVALISGLGAVYSWNLTPGSYDAFSRNCVYGVCRIGPSCGVSTPAFIFPGFWHPSQLSSWLDSL